MFRAIALSSLLFLSSGESFAGWKTNAIIGITGYVAKDFTKACLKDAQCRAKGKELAVTGFTRLVQRYGHDAIGTCLSNHACRNGVVSAVSTDSNVITALEKGAAVAAGGPPGNCGEHQYNMLNTEVTNSCKGLPKGAFTCRKGETFEQLSGKMASATKCADARMNRENLCYGGGDKGHKMQIGQMRNIANQCGSLMMRTAR